MSAWEGCQVLVTGAGGFIGSHLAEALVQAGARVRALVRYNGRGDPGMLGALPRELQERIDVRAGDIRDPYFVDELVAGCQVVFHLAALIGIPYSYVAPADYVATNVTGTLHVLEACRRRKVNRLVQTSTSEVYGTAQFVPMTEEHPLQPQSPYAASKVAADALALSYVRTYATPVVVVRPFNTYGPRQSQRAVIPTILRQLQEADRVELGSVDPQRDFTFVSDTVRGFMRLAQSDPAVGQVVHLGSEQMISIGDLVELCMRVTGLRKPLVTVTKRQRPETSEVDRLQASAQRAQSLVGWRAEVDLATGIAQTADFLARQPSSPRSGYAI